MRLGRYINKKMDGRHSSDDEKGHIYGGN